MRKGGRYNSSLLSGGNEYFDLTQVEKRSSLRRFFIKFTLGRKEKQRIKQIKLEQKNVEVNFDK